MTDRARRAEGLVIVAFAVCCMAGCRTATARKTFTFKMHPNGGREYTEKQIKALDVYPSQAITARCWTESPPATTEIIDGKLVETKHPGKEASISIGKDAVGKVQTCGTDPREGTFLLVAFPYQFESVRSDLKIKFVYSDDPALPHKGFTMRSMIKPSEVGFEQCELPAGESPTYLQFIKLNVRR